MSSESFPCPKCQNNVMSGSRFCMRCGTRMEAAPTSARFEAPKPAGTAAAAAAPDPWAPVAIDHGLEALELSLDAAPPKVIPPPPVAAAPSAAPAPLASTLGAKVTAPAPAAPTPAAAVSAPAAPASMDTRAKGGTSREEVLRKIKAKQAMKGASLAGIDLSGANLEGVDFSRADLEGANLDDAKLSGAVMTSASLRGASLKRANLEGANLARADLEGADLSDARLVRANLERASMDRVNLERAILIEAILSAAELSQAELSAADLSRADVRFAVFEGSVLNGVRFDGAKLSGVALQGARVTRPSFEWLDVSPTGDGSQRLDGDRAFAFLGSGRPSLLPKTRYFGRGDVLRDATLQFDSGSIIHIDSRFENCLILLGEGAELTIGKAGVLSGCEIVGSGRVTVHGRFFERSSPGISGVRSVVVSGTGGIVGGLEQSPDATLFAFEPGCRLRVKIMKPRLREAAE